MWYGQVWCGALNILAHSDLRICRISFSFISIMISDHANTQVIYVPAVNTDKTDLDDS